jgi:hypothetical protein
MNRVGLQENYADFTGVSGFLIGKVTSFSRGPSATTRPPTKAITRWTISSMMGLWVVIISTVEASKSLGQYLIAAH